MQRVLLLGLCIAGGVAYAAPRGRVVRVESARASKKSPTLCQIETNLQGMCLGSRPAVGDIVVMHHAGGIAAEVELVRVDTRNGCEGIWAVHGSLRSGKLDGVRQHVGMGGEDTRRYRWLDPKGQEAPTKNAEEQVALAFDADADDTPDLLVTRYRCDAQGAPSQTPTDRCIDIHTRTRKGMARTSQTKLMGCR